tara:strand:+ start:324 stop:629 length:306 start_codon:yes stop_codon:yes gene_type:complete
MDKFNLLDIILTWEFLCGMTVIFSPFLLWGLLVLLENLPRKQVFVCLECKREWAERHWQIRYGYKRGGNMEEEVGDLVTPNFDQPDAGFRAALWLEQNRKV